MSQPPILKKLKFEWFYEGLQDPLELTPNKDVFFIIGSRTIEAWPGEF